MTIKFHLLDAMREIPLQRKDEIMRELQAANERIARFIQLDRLDIVVAPEAWVIPELGLCGRANGPGRITITLDPRSPRMDDPERSDRILGTLAHEMHHVARLRRGVEKYTLGARFVSEGLAQCFEEEVGAPTPFYAKALDAKTLFKMAERARPVLSSTCYAHDAWMFGRNGDSEWPRHAGYSLGYALVRAWLDRFEVSASEAVGVLDSTITDDWRTRRISLQISTE